MHSQSDINPGTQKTSSSFSNVLCIPEEVLEHIKLTEVKDNKKTLLSSHKLISPRKECISLITDY